MKIKVICIISLFINNIKGQEVSFFPELNLKKGALLGELHYHGGQTSRVQYQIFQEAVNQENISTVEFLLELPPSLAYFMKMYYETGNEDFLVSDPLRGNKELVDLLRNDTNRIDIVFTGLDLEYKGNFRNISKFIEFIFQENIEETEFKHLNWKRKKQIFKLFERINKSDSLKNKYLTLIRDDWCINYFIEEVNILSDRGLLLNKGRSKKQIINREKQFLKHFELENKFSNYRIFTLGRAHLFNMYKILQSLNNDLCLIPIFYYEKDGIVFNGDVINTKAGFDKLVETHIINCYLTVY